MAEQQMTGSEAVEYTGESRQRLYKLLRLKYIPATKMAGAWQVSQSVLDKWMAGPRIDSTYSDRLRAIGVDAWVDDYEYSINDKYEEGIHLVRVNEGPIRQIGFRHGLAPVWDDRVSDPGVNIYWGVDYRIPDSRISTAYPIMEFRSVQLKRFPIFGRVTGIRWKVQLPKDSQSRRMADQLSKNHGLNSSVLELDESELYLTMDCSRREWKLGTPMWGGLLDDAQIPFQDLLKDYRSIARALLDVSVPTA